MLKKNRWIDSSSQADQYPQYRENFTDEEYLRNLRIREPAIRYIIQNFIINDKDPLDYLNYPVLLIGVRSFPMGIELSQWGYPITLCVRNYEEERVANKNASIQNGRFTKIMKYDYRKGVKESKIIIWINDDKSIPEEHIEGWIDYLKTRCQVLIFAVKKTKNNFRIINNLKNCTHQQLTSDYYFGISYH